MSDEVLLPVKLVEMRQWASEQSSPEVRRRVILLCDAVEECGLAVHNAQVRVEGLKRRIEEFQHELDHLVDGGR